MKKPEKKEVPQFGTAQAATPSTPPPRLLISYKELPNMGINYSLNHLRRMWTAGKFPVPTYTSSRKFSWPVAVLERWINKKIASSTKAGRSKAA